MTHPLLDDEQGNEYLLAILKIRQAAYQTLYQNPEPNRPSQLFMDGMRAHGTQARIEQLERELAAEARATAEGTK